MTSLKPIMTLSSENAELTDGLKKEALMVKLRPGATVILPFQLKRKSYLDANFRFGNGTDLMKTGLSLHQSDSHSEPL